ncbi:MAG: tetratricopeptide repeat protein [Planctomycetes bacterium]|nr:tetratricopeptide repeat protein [Planctomycetota bacterium]
MAPRYFNWKLATVLMVAAVILVAAAYALHRWQRTNRAVQALPPGEAAYAKQDYDGAARLLGSYLAVHRDNVEVLVKYADAQLQRRPRTSNNVQQAIAAYRDVLRLEGRHREATRRLVEVYLGGAPGEAELIARRYLEFEDDVTVRRMLADAYALQRKPKEAAAELTTILQKHPEDVLSYERMGALAEQNPDTVGKPAAAWYDEAVARNPQAALAYTVRAGFHLQQSNRYQAMANQEQARKERDQARIHLEQARKEREQALADLEQAQKHDCPDTETGLRLVAELVRANLLDRARERLQMLQAKDPTDLSLWRYRADLAVRGKSAEEMCTVAEAGLKALAAQPWDFMSAAAELLIRSGRVEEANECISRMRTKDVDPPTVALLEGLLADKQGRLRDAIAAWRKAVTLGYRQPAVRLQLAYALSRVGDIQAAIDQLRLLVVDAPNNVEGHLALAQLLAQTGNWPEAQEQALLVQQLVPDHPDAVLLELQARMQALASATAPAEEREKAWQEIDTRLTALDKKDAGNTVVKLLQAQAAMVRGKFPEMAVLLKEMEVKDPNNMKVVLLRADLCAAQGQKEEAQTRLRDAVKRFPQALEPVRGLASLLDQQNQRQACEAVLQQSMQRIKEPAVRRNVGLLLAEFYRRWDEQGKLADWLRELSARFPSDIQLKRMLLTREEIGKDAPQAQKIVDEIHGLEGEEGWQWRYEQARLWSRGSAEDFKARYPQMVKLLQENLQINAKDPESRLLLAETYERANELPLAANTYRELQNLLPDNLPLLVRTAVTLNRVKDFDGVRRLLDQADQKNLHDPLLDRLRLQDNLRTGQLEGAVDALEKMAQQDPNDTSLRLRLASLRVREKKYEEAQKVLDELQAKTPDSMPVIRTQINLYVQQGKGAEAIGLCDRMVERLHNAPAYLLRAQTYIALKQNDKALEDYGRVIALDPQQALSWAARADFYRLTGRVRDGIADIQQAAALAPDNTAVQRLQVVLFLASGEVSLVGRAGAIVDKALAALAKPPAAHGEDPKAAEYTQLRLLKAQVLLLRGTGPSVESARRILHEVTSSEPTLAQAWQGLAQLELSQEDPARALDAARRGLAHNPDDATLLLLKARAEKVRSPTVAALTLKGLLEKNPQNVEVVIELADAYARSGRAQQAVDLLHEKLPAFEGRDRRRCEIAQAEAWYVNGQKEEAKALFDQLMQAEPNDPTPAMTLAQQLRKERRWGEMNGLVQRWLTAHPRDAGVATIIARALAATGDKQALSVGEDILRTTLDRNPQSLPALMLLGMMMQDTGRNEESAERNRQVLALDPNNVIAMNNLAWALCEGENPPSVYQEALALTEKGLRLAPDYVDLLDTRGYAFFRLNNFDKAVADFVHCTELYPPNSPSVATPRYHLAKTYEAMKRRAEAQEQLRMALDLNAASLRLAKEQADSGRTTYAIKVFRDALALQTQMELLKAALGLSGQANGPSPQDVTEAKAFLDQLQKDTY